MQHTFITFQFCNYIFSHLYIILIFILFCIRNSLKWNCAVVDLYTKSGSKIMDPTKKCYLTGTKHVEPNASCKFALHIKFLISSL